MKNDPKIDLKPLVEKSFGETVPYLEKEGLLTDLNFYNPVFINDVIQKGIQKKDKEILEYFLDDETHLKKMLENNYILQENFMLVKFFNEFLSIVGEDDNEKFIKKIYQKTRDWCQGQLSDIRSQWIDRLIDHFKKGNVYIACQLNVYCVKFKFLSGTSLINEISWDNYLNADPNRAMAIILNLPALGFKNDFEPINYSKMNKLVTILLNWCKKNKQNKDFITILNYYLSLKQDDSEIKIEEILHGYSEHYLQINYEPDKTFLKYAKENGITVKLFIENNKLSGIKRGDPIIIKNMLEEVFYRSFYKDPSSIKFILDENKGESPEAIENAEKIFDLITPFCSIKDQINLLLRYASDQTYIVPVMKLFLNIQDDIPSKEKEYIKNHLSINSSKTNHEISQKWYEENLEEGIANYVKYLSVFSRPSKYVVHKIIHYYNNRVASGSIGVGEVERSGKELSALLFKLDNFKDILKTEASRHNITTFFKTLVSILDGTEKLTFLENILSLPSNLIDFYDIYPKMDIVLTQIIRNAVQTISLTKLDIILNSPMISECASVIRQNQNTLLRNIIRYVKDYISNPNEIVRNFIINNWTKLEIEYHFTDFNNISLHDAKLNVFEDFIEIIEALNTSIQLEDKITMFKVAVRENYSIMRFMVKKYEELDFTYDSTNRTYKYIIHDKEYFALQAYKNGNIDKLMEILKIKNKYCKYKKKSKKIKSDITDSCPILGTCPNERIKIHHDHIFSIDGLLGWIDFKKHNICPQCNCEFKWESSSIVLYN